MAFTTEQKVQMLRGLGRMMRAFVDGAALASEQAQMAKAASKGLTGILPQKVVKPGCNVCDGKKRGK